MAGFVPRLLRAILAFPRCTTRTRSRTRARSLDRRCHHASSTNLQMIVGDGGAGKSLAASLVFQLAIDRALQDGNARFPVFVNARDLHEPLDEYIKTKTTGLVQPFHQQTLIIIDGLDETGVSRANELIGQVHVYLRAYKNSIVLLTTRALPGLKTIDQYTTLDPLHDTVAVDLIGRIAGRGLELTELYSWSASMRDADTRHCSL